MTDTVDVDDDVVRIGKFRGLGVAMGLEGKPLTQYIERCMEKHEERVKEEQQAVREERREQAVREERERERETAKEIELAKLQTNKELELARLQAETERGELSTREAPVS